MSLAEQDFSKQAEDELGVLFADDNRAAFKQLYISYYSRLYAYTLKFVKSSELAEDIVQEVFLKLWEGRHKLTEVNSFRSYLFTICKNTTLSYLSRAAVERDIKNKIIAAAPTHHSDTEHTILYNEFEEVLYQAIEQLPPQRRQIFTLCKLEGKTYEEVANHLGISPGTVNDHIVKATKSIREFLLPYNIPFKLLLLLYLLR